MEHSYIHWNISIVHSLEYYYRTGEHSVSHCSYYLFQVKGLFVISVKGTFITNVKGTFVTNVTGTFIAKIKGTFITNVKGTFITNAKGIFIGSRSIYSSHPTGC